MSASIDSTIYIDEHVSWLNQHGSRQFEAGVPPNQIPERFLGMTLPAEVLAWYRSPLCSQVGAVIAIDTEGMFFKIDESTLYDHEPENFRDLQVIGAFPRAPLPFAFVSSIHLYLESVGPQMGWIYADYLGEPIGPIAASIPQYLLAIRSLVLAGILPKPSEPPVPHDGSDFAGDRWPPLDTPGPLVGLPWTNVEAFAKQFRPDGVETIADSIADLAPGFQLVTMEF